MDVRAVKYHLDFLEKHEAIASLMQEGYLRYYPRKWDEGYFRERIGASEKRVLGLLRQRVPLHITLLLIERGEMSGEEIQQQAGIAASTLTYHMKKLVRLQLIESRTEDRKKAYRVADPGTLVQLLMEYRPTTDLVEDFLDLWKKIQI